MAAIKIPQKSIVLAAVDEDTATKMSNKSILGTFEGECADSNITNENGLDITREVWETVFASDDYKKAIKLGWYIGFLGHPEDPNCMDFEHACIVMRECHIAPDGKIYGKFDLINTNVGRIVKAFIDAGVGFGISVRGAGDIENNSVDPDTFVFRGFDLVTFPAFPDAIPTFSEIAASSDIKQRQKYKKICAAIDANIDGINTVEAATILQSCFAPQSDEYKKLEDKKSELSKEGVDGNDAGIVDEEKAILAQKLEGVMQLYLAASAEVDRLSSVLASAQRQAGKDKITAARKLASVKRIADAQVKRFEHHCQSIEDENNGLKQAVTAAKKSNLIYKQEITATRNELKAKDDVIASLEAKRRETVTAAKDLKAAASNRDEENKSLRATVKGQQKLLAEFAETYAKIYASAMGVSLSSDELRDVVASCKSVDEVEHYISGATNTANIGVAPFVEPEPVILDNDDDEDLITL